MSDFEVYQRSTGKIVKEDVFGASALNFTCNNFFGKMLTGLFLKRKLASKIISLRYKSKRSVKMIPSFMEKYGISPDELDRPLSEYSTFNEFFIRKKQDGGQTPCPGVLISPAESRLSVYRICHNNVFSIKGIMYTVEELLQSAEEAAEFENGYCLVFRLSPADYHRYIFPDNGKIENEREIKGFYRTVNTFYESPKVHVTNYRQVSTLSTESFGKMAFVEVGAMVIGKIIHTFQGPEAFCQGQEKGYFEYGASTIVLLLKEGSVKIDSDILEQSAKGLECLVKCGEKIGEKI